MRGGKGEGGGARSSKKTYLERRNILDFVFLFTANLKMRDFSARYVRHAPAALRLRNVFGYILCSGCVARCATRTRVRSLPKPARMVRVAQAAKPKRATRSAQGARAREFMS